MRFNDRLQWKSGRMSDLDAHSLEGGKNRYRMERPRTKLISVIVDLNTTWAYIQYSHPIDHEIVGTLDVWQDGQVAADMDDGANVVGIEVLGFDQVTLAEARRFAEERGLEFPYNLKTFLSRVNTKGYWN
jgi:hypothetical protein